MLSTPAWRFFTWRWHGLPCQGTGRRCGAKKKAESDKQMGIGVGLTPPPEPELMGGKEAGWEAKAPPTATATTTTHGSTTIHSKQCHTVHYHCNTVPSNLTPPPSKTEAKKKKMTTKQIHRRCISSHFLRFSFDLQQAHVFLSLSLSLLRVALRSVRFCFWAVRGGVLRGKGEEERERDKGALGCGRQAQVLSKQNTIADDETTKKGGWVGCKVVGGWKEVGGGVTRESIDLRKHLVERQKKRRKKEIFW